MRCVDTAVHAPITEAADPEDKQQEEEDSMEGTHTVSGPTADSVWLTAETQTYARIIRIDLTNLTCNVHAFCSGQSRT